MAIQKCAICYRESADGGRYCGYHGQALQELKKHFKIWEEAYGSISWDEFLAKISKRKETGTWIKEVAAAEKKKDD